MLKTSTIYSDANELDLHDLDLSGLEVHAVRDAFALPETGASASVSWVWELFHSSSCVAN